MADESNRPFTYLERRKLLKTAAVAGAAVVAPAALRDEAAHAQGRDSTLVIAAPATPQGLDIEFDVSLGSIDSLSYPRNRS